MEPAGRRHKWLITLTVMSGAILGSLDASIVNVALPNMRGALSASMEGIAWVSTGYILSSVIVMPIVALLSSRFGRKRFYLFSVVLFTVASTLCGFAWDLASMVSLRIIQGVGAGALIPLAQAILRETFPPEEQPMASGIYGFGVMLGPAIGPTIGGWLTDHYSWPWIFYIKWPVGVITALLIIRYIEDPPFLVRDRGKMDLPGVALLALGLGALQIMLEKGQQRDWFASDLIVLLGSISVLALGLFIRRELTTDKPAVDLKILKNVNLSAASILGGVIGIALMGSLFLIPLFLQQVLHYPAMDAGLTILPRSIAMITAMPIAGRIYNRTGPKLLTAAGFFLLIVSFYQFSRLSLHVGYWDIFLPQFLQGFGFGVIFVSLSTAALSTFEKKFLTAASGLYNVIRQVAGSIGIALAATLLTRGETWNRALLVEHVNVFRGGVPERLDAYAQLLESRGADSTEAAQGALKMLDGIVNQQSVMLSYNHCFYLASVMFVISLPLILLIKGGFPKERN